MERVKENIYLTFCGQVYLPLQKTLHFHWYLCVFVSKITQKLLYHFSQDSVERLHTYTAEETIRFWWVSRSEPGSGNSFYMDFRSLWTTAVFRIGGICWTNFQPIRATACFRLQVTHERQA